MMKTDALKEAQAEVEQALQLSDTETADSLIGDSPPDEYGQLVRGMRGAYMMLWAMAARNGLRHQKADVQTMGSQALLVMVTLVHYAYALGIKHGQEEQC